LSNILNRRKFIFSGITNIAAYGLVGSCYAKVRNEKVILQNHNITNRIENLARIFCTAYITPDDPSQANQERIVAKYPLIIVPQDNRRHFIKWRENVKNLNPDIIMLAYQMVIEETTVPGAGHDVLRKINNSWCVYPGGYLPKVGPSDKRRRIFDPRHDEWKSGFISSCHSTLNSYGYDGLFLDQCTIFPISNPFHRAREDMRRSLQKTLLELRRELPDTILVGNCRDSWSGLNGEMNEARKKDMGKELAYYAGHAKPRIELVQSRVKEINSKRIISDMRLAHQYDAFFGVAQDYQHVIWLDEFDDILNKNV